MSKAGWSWKPLPNNLMDNAVFLEMEVAPRCLLYALYHSCDKLGRFSCARPWLIRETLLMPEVTANLPYLEQEGFVSIYEVNGKTYGQLVGYLDFAPGDFIKRNKDDRFPEPSEGVATSLQPDCNIVATSLQPSCNVPSEPPTPRVSEPLQHRCNDVATMLQLEETRQEEKRQDETTGEKGLSDPPAGAGETGLSDQSSQARPSGDCERCPDGPTPCSLTDVCKGAPQSRPGDEKPGERDAAIAAFTAEYELKLSRMELREPGRRGAGFFGPNSVPEVEKQLQHIWDVAPRTGRHVCARLWEHLKKSPEGFRGIEREINEFAISNGMPTNAAIILRQMAEDERKAR